MIVLLITVIVCTFIVCECIKSCVKVKRTPLNEYCVKITETRYEYIEAPNERSALKLAKKGTPFNVDAVRCEIVKEPGD